jgi:hypothetical protein
MPLLAGRMAVAVVSARSSQTAQRALLGLLLLRPQAAKLGTRHLPDDRATVKRTHTHTHTHTHDYALKQSIADEYQIASVPRTQHCVLPSLLLHERSSQ